MVHGKSVLMMFVLVLLFVITASYSQPQIAPPVGIRHNTPTVHAFTNARIVTAPGIIIEKGTLVIRDGIIIAVGADVEIPADARRWDMTGMTIYPGLIDSYSDFGMPKKPQQGFGMGGGEQQPKPPEARGPKHWNNNVLSGTNAEELFMPDAKAAEKLRGIGFTTVHVVPQKGIFHGTTALFDLGDDTPNDLLVKPAIGQYVTIETSSDDGYPNSLMGAVALIRQTFIDALWHKSAMEISAKNPSIPKPEFVPELAALEAAATGKEPVIFETTDELSLLRAGRIADEFHLKWWARGSGSEYRRLDAVKKTGVPILLPVAYPETPSVQTPEEALNISLQDLRYWDEAPDNAKKLADAGITFVFTTAKLKDAGLFMGNLRKAIERGLTADQALAALTTTPAKLFGVNNKIGSLEAGKTANFVVADGDLFNEKTKVMETWVEGKRYEVKAKPQLDPRGKWAAKFTGAPVDSFTLSIKGDIDKPEGNITVKGKDTKLTTLNVSDLRIALSFSGDSLSMSGIIRLTATATGNTLIGTGELPDGKSIQWNAVRTEAFKPAPDTSKPKPPAKSSFSVVYPDGEFGRSKPPEQPSALLVKGATIWTSGPKGNIENGDLLIEKGKIKEVGQNLEAPADAVIIDGKGKQVTPGIIDCHSHSAAAGSVNETGKTITSEVRIGDVIDCDDISIYRELANGTTEANVLHGSANPIGGHNQVIKMRWGALPEEMKFDGAMPGIKFALGENPKGSNWGDRYNTRYPQTREGVEQIIRDEFKSARDYMKAQKEYEDGKIKIPPRRNLQTEALAEVLEGKRLVHAHSYRQDEILMLMRVADDFGFKVGTFQHVLEGYKVADQLAAHGAGASCFSDWWAYKFEVYDAIPYNGVLMHNQGVVVSYNSDSDEQACRLNTEAAKAVKYGGVPPQDALKFVTLNPAIQLHIDKNVGSLEPGKDADFVIWSGDPLSSYSIAEQTWIDGKKYFDREEDLKAQDEIQKERAVLIQKALGGKKESGGSPAGPAPKKERYSCQDEEMGKGSR
ncbi:MAG: amidohydrolase family protein [Bacteroidota bacterium]